jgi:hypothetical protein
VCWDYDPISLSHIEYPWVAMAEWLILLLLVPAIVVPVVLLVGFAGCNRVFGITSFPPSSPIIDSAVGKSARRITLTWEWSDTAQRFEFVRINPDHTSFSFSAPASPFDDTGRLLADIEGLKPETSYTYQCAAVLNDGSMSNWSGFVTGTTLAFQTTFDETFAFEDQALGQDSGGWEGYTLVQRIEAAALTPLSPMDRAVDQVRITLRASNASDASIDRIFISQTDPTLGANPYDSATDHMEVPLPTTPFVVGKGTSPTLVVDYTGVQPAKAQGPNDPGRPLLIAVQFTPPPSASGIRYEDGVPSSKATAYWKQVAEADFTTRSATYQSQARIYLIEKVELG